MLTVLGNKKVGVASVSDQREVWQEAGRQVGGGQPLKGLIGGMWILFKV